MWENQPSQDTAKVSGKELVNMNNQDVAYLKSITDGAQAKAPTKIMADWRDRSLVDRDLKNKAPVAVQDKEYTQAFATSLQTAIESYDQYVFEARIQLDKKANEYKLKETGALFENDYQKQEYDDFNLNLFKTYCKTVLKEAKMIEEFENNSNFAGVVSMKWISNHTASGTLLKNMNKDLKDKASAEVSQEATQGGNVELKLGMA